MGKYNIKNVSIGMVFSPLKWEAGYEHDKPWKRIAVDIGCFMFTIQYG